MAEQITFLPITETAKAALRFCDSPFIRLGEAMAETALKRALPIEDRMVIVLDRCKDELQQKWADLYETILCLTTPESRLKQFLCGTPEEFEAAAQREVKDRVPPEVLSILIDTAFIWWGEHIRSESTKGVE